MGEKHSVVGKRLPDVSGLEKITGAAKFISDMHLPGILIGKVLHSPYAHAKIVDIDTSKAERVQGLTVVTHKDAQRRDIPGRS